MKAVVMAGGEGSRLRPLTSRQPKPLVPVVGRPIMEHILLHLRRHQMRDVVATVQYLGSSIRNYFGDGSEQGVALTYSVEDSPLGTAGSVMLARQFLTDTFVVISGDALTDIDLAAAARFHRERKSLATIVLKPVPNPLEYGVVVVDEGGAGQRVGEGIWIHEDAEVAPSARVDGPALICAGAKVRAGAWVNGPCVVGPFTTIDRGAKVSNSIMWDHSYIGETSRLRGSVVCRSVTVKNGCVLEEGSVIGSDVVIGA